MAQIQSLAQKLPYARGVAIKLKKKKKLQYRLVFQSLGSGIKSGVYPSPVSYMIMGKLLDFLKP